MKEIEKTRTSEGGFKYFISAGEASGDLHGSELMKEIKSLDPGAKFAYLGGERMESICEVAPTIDYRNMAFMGFSEVLRNLKQISRNLKTAKNELRKFNPSCLILIDYPSFNLKLANYAHKLGIPVYWYISPKVWAWKEYRVKTIKRIVRKVICILPFEVDFYKKHGVNAIYAGNPTLEELDRHLKDVVGKDKFLAQNNLSEKQGIIAIIPGSRRGEIKNNLPIMAEAASQYPEFTAVIAGAPGIEENFYRSFSTLPIVWNQTAELMYHSRAALVTSGTATLECAMSGTPQVVCYRANGSKLSYSIMKKILKIPFVSLPNLIAGKKIIPELLVHLCTIETVSSNLREILYNNAVRESQIEGYNMIRNLLGSEGASLRAAKTIVKDLNTLRQHDT